MDRRLKLPLLVSVLMNVILIIWMISLETSTDLDVSGDGRDESIYKHFSVKSPGSSILTDFSSTSCQVIGHDKSRITNTSTLQGFANTLKTVLPTPDQFDPKYRNPCWSMYLHIPTKVIKKFHKNGHLDLNDREAASIMSQMFQLSPERTLVCIPQVYFIGFPRCGSTQLYKMLVEHPEIRGGHNKEPHWWTRTHYTSKFPHDVINIIRYLTHFEPAVEYVKKHRDALLIDASQSTIWDTRNTGDLCFIPRLISGAVPHAKYIVLMRNPVDRLYSDFSYLCEEYWKNNGGGGGGGGGVDGFHGNISAAGMFHESVLKEVEGFSECLKTDSLEECTHYSSSGKILSGKVSSGCGRVRLGISLYHVHIKRWLKEVSRDHFLFLRTEELATDPLQMLKKVWDFLGVAKQSASDLEGILHKHLHSTGHVTSRPQSGKTGIGVETEKILKNLFQSHNDALAELIRDDRFRWS